MLKNSTTMHRIGKAFAALLLLGLPLNLPAHEGHGHGAGHELSHYWFSSEHIVPVALILALTVAVILFRRRPRKQTSEEQIKRH